MQSETRPFFLSFEKALHDRLPRRELLQAMEEAMWEYASMHRRDPAGRIIRHDTLIRIGSICLAFFRLMIKSGYPPEEANARINQACHAFEGPLEPVPKSVECPVAGYFLAKGEPSLCEAAFCSRCSQKNAGCQSLNELDIRLASERVVPKLASHPIKMESHQTGAKTGRAFPAGITA